MFPPSTLASEGYDGRVKTKAAPRAYHHGDLRNALLETAVAQIARHGGRGLSLREVARLTGVTHSSAYRHFPNKESLLASIAEQGFRALSAAMRSAASAHAGEPVAMLRATGLAYVDFAVGHPHHLQVMFSDLIECHDAYPGLVEASREAFDGLVSVVRAGLESGGLAPADERIAALTAWSQVHGLALLISSGKIRTPDGKPPSDHRALTEAVLARLDHGLLARHQGSD